MAVKGILTDRQVSALKVGESISDPAPRGAGRLQARKLKSGVAWYFRYTGPDGHRVRHVLGSGLTLAEARRAASDYSRIYQQGNGDLRGQIEVKEREAQHQLAQLDAGMRRAQHLIGQLLRLSRQEAPASTQPLAALDITALLRDSVGQLMPLADQRQIEVAADVAAQVTAGDGRIVGVMIESHLQEGRQDIVPGQPLRPGVSVTDACIGFEQTVPVLQGLAAAVRARRVRGSATA